MKLINKILTEWSYRVHDGMPNPKNAQHIQELRESMEELNLPNKVIYQVIQNLINEEENPILKKKMLLSKMMFKYFHQSILCMEIYQEE